MRSRRASWRREWLVLIVLCASASNAFAQSDSGPSIEIYLPDRMNEGELHAAKRLLSLSEAQGEILNRLHATYVELWRDLTESAAAKLAAAGVDAGRLFLTKSGEYGWEAVEAFERLESMRSDLILRMNSLDLAMWNQLEPLLSESQRVQLVRVRNQRARDCCRLTSRELHGSRVDLARLLRRNKLDPDPQTELDLIMAEYDAAITEPWLRLDEQLNRTEADTLAAAAELLFRRPPPAGRPAQPAETYEQRLGRIKRPAVRIERRIITLNKVFLQRILQLLSDDARKTLKANYDSIAYPALYPDQLDPTSVYEEMLASPDLTNGQRDIVNGIWIGYRSGYDLICQRMERLEDDWWEEFALTRGATNLQQFRQVMQELRNARWERGAAVVQQLHAALSSEAQKATRSLVEDYVGHVNRFLTTPQQRQFPR